MLNLVLNLAKATLNRPRALGWRTMSGRPHTLPDVFLLLGVPFRTNKFRRQLVPLELPLFGNAKADVHEWLASGGRCDPVRQAGARPQCIRRLREFG